jgi:hypothetical protein
MGISGTGFLLMGRADDLDKHPDLFMLRSFMGDLSCI